MPWPWRRPKKVLVTGAGGMTGTIVVRKLLERGLDCFSVRAMVRTEVSKTRLLKILGLLADEGRLEIVEADVTRPDSLPAAFAGVDAVVILTSARPFLGQVSAVKSGLLDLLSWGMVAVTPDVHFEKGQSPEEVDFLGLCAQIDAAKAAGVSHVVLISSMAGTKPDHALNKMRGNIALWKRKGEYFLIDSGLPYTIMHVPTLLPAAGSRRAAPGGQRRLLVGVEDSIINSVLAREDLAEVCVKALMLPASRWRSFDLGSSMLGQGEVRHGDMEVLQELLIELRGKNCSYDACHLASNRSEAQGRFKVDLGDVAVCCSAPKCGLMRRHDEHYDMEVQPTPVVETDAAFPKNVRHLNGHNRNHGSDYTSSTAGFSETPETSSRRSQGPFAMSSPEGAAVAAGTEESGVAESWHASGGVWNSARGTDVPHNDGSALAVDHLSGDHRSEINGVH